MAETFIVSLDQGTTSSRCVIFDHNGVSRAIAQTEITQYYPETGWVEQDPLEIYQTQIDVMKEAIELLNINPSQIEAIGITNQRETTVIWDKRTGKPIYNAIVWQCRRTADRIETLKKEGLESYIQNTTGLIADAYFSGTKIEWILDHVEGSRELAKEGHLLFGTIETWLLWKLTQGNVHASDYTNASRTMLFDIHKLTWDQKLLDLFDIPLCMLPSVYPSSYQFGEIDESILGVRIPVTGIAGDQQAALFGQCCFHSGDVKNTYGTGCFLLMNIGKEAIISKQGLITTIAAGDSTDVEYALEGSVFIGGAVVQWLRDELKLINNASASESHALSVEDTQGVYLVPAFVGLGAPYWNPYARGMIVGATRGTNQSHIIRAALESIAFQVNDVVNAMERESGFNVNALKVDGGASLNNFLMQFQSNVSQNFVFRTKCAETTALGVAFLAGLKVGYWKDHKEIEKNWNLDIVFTPKINKDETDELLYNWHRAVDTALYWANYKKS